MPAPATVDDFVNMVRQSGLVEDSHVEKVLDNAAHAETPRHLASLLISEGLLTRFQAEQIVRGKYRGFTIGKYKVLERIGAGGNSNVYLCEHKVVRRRVAIKVLPTDRATSSTTLARFYREARAAGALDHPNLVKAHDIGQEGSLHFLVMDYVDGSSLQDIISRFGPLPVSRSVNYIRQAALGLQRLHEAGLVHRDVKPGNILLDRGGVIRLLDLGLARFFLDEDESLTLKLEGKCVLGTADYLSPEQALNSHEVDFRSDVYSLGATFYFILTGQPLFATGTVSQKLMWHQVRQPSSINEVRPDLSPALAAVVMKMVAKSPTQRYQNMAEIILALAPWYVEVEPPSEVEMPRLCPAARGRSSSEDLAGPLRMSKMMPTVSSLQTSTRSSERTSSHATGGGCATSEPPRRPVSLVDLCTPPLGNAPTISAPAIRPPEVKGPALGEGPTNLGKPSQGPSTPAVPRPRPVVRVSRQRQALRLAFILILGIAVGTTARCFVGRYQLSAQPASPALVPPPLIVSRSRETGTFASLADALQHAQAGDHIVINAEAWQEAFSWQQDVPVPPGLHIEGQSPLGGPVLWLPPEGHPAHQPLLHLRDCASLTLSGFTLDGRGTVQDVIVLSGSCPGLRLHNLHIRGFDGSGITLRNAQGSTESPMTLSHLRIRTEKPVSSALHLEALAGHRTQQVVLRDCRLEGPFHAAIHVSGGCEDVVVQHNRIYRSQVGLLGSQLEGAMARLSLSGNTFCSLDRAVLQLTSLPDLDQSHFQLTRNLFVGTGALADIEGVDLNRDSQTRERLAAGAFGNVSDRSGLAGASLFRAVVRPVSLGLDLTDDTHFLRYPPSLFGNSTDAPGVLPVRTSSSAR